MAYFRSDGNFIYLEAEYAEFYIPKYYFDETGKFAQEHGEIIHSIGLFDVGFFKGGKLEEMKVFNLPTWVDFFVNDVEDKNISLPNDPESSTPCKVLKYQKGHKILSSTVIEDSDNCAAYLNFILQGHVPSIVPYEKSLQIWRKNQDLNSVNLGVPSVILELLLSVSYRDKTNPGTKFAHVIGKDPNTSQYDYVMNNIRQICQYTSTFTGITFEDIDSMITTSLNRTKNKGEESFSPIEQLITL